MKHSWFTWCYFSHHLQGSCLKALLSCLRAYEPSKGRQQVSGVAGVWIKCVHISCTYIFVYIHLWLYVFIHISIPNSTCIFIFTIPHCGCLNHQSHTFAASGFSSNATPSSSFFTARSGDIWTSKSLARSIPGANRSSAPVNTTTGGRATGMSGVATRWCLFGCIFSIKGGGGFILKISDMIYLTFLETNISQKLKVLLKMMIFRTSPGGICDLSLGGLIHKLARGLPSI